jgi:hypothetical protein
MAMKEAETRSIEILENITAGLDFTIPNVDFTEGIYNIPQEIIDALRTPPEKLTPGLLTERKVNGNGMFDQLMTAFKVHIMEEYDSGRITGAEYTKAYIALSQAALQYAVQYLLGRDQAYYGALNGLLQGYVTGINANVAKVQLAIAQAQAHKNKADYANSVLTLGVNDSQRELVKENREQVRAQTVDTRTDGSGVTGILGEHKVLLQKQQTLTQEQAEQYHAQTADKRLDGANVVGKIGKEKDVYTEQINSYRKDAAQKTAKLAADIWTTQKTVDAGIVVPSSLNNAAIDTVMNKLKDLSITNISLDS